MSDFNVKMHKSRSRWGSAPDPAAKLTALPRPYLYLRRPTSKGRAGKGREWMGRGGKGKRREEKREVRGGKGRE